MKWASGSYHLFEEADLHVWVYECCVISYECLRDIGHDAGVVAWEAFSSIHLHTKTSPRSLRRETFREQQVPETEVHESAETCISIQPKIINKAFSSHLWISINAAG